MLISRLTEILQLISMPCIPPELELMVPDAVAVGGIVVVIDPMKSILEVGSAQMRGALSI